MKRFEKGVDAGSECRREIRSREDWAWVVVASASKLSEESGMSNQSKGTGQGGGRGRSRIKSLKEIGWEVREEWVDRRWMEGGIMRGGGESEEEAKRRGCRKLLSLGGRHQQSSRTLHSCPSQVFFFFFPFFLFVEPRSKTGNWSAHAPYFSHSAWSFSPFLTHN